MGKPVCLLHRANVAVFKEYNLRRHYNTKHKDRYKNIVVKEIAKSAGPFAQGVCEEPHD